MAKIKISGYSELISVTDQEAKAIQQMLGDKTIAKDAVVNLRNSTVTKGDIKAVFIDQTSLPGNDVHSAEMKKYYDWRDAFIKLPASEKAEKNLRHFKFFCDNSNCKYTPELKDKFLPVVTKWFEENPLYARPPMFLYNEITGLGKNIQLKGIALSILERMEGSEHSDVNQTVGYVKSVDTNEKYLEQQEEKVVKMINPFVEEIPVINIDEVISADDLPF